MIRKGNKIVKEANRLTRIARSIAFHFVFKEILFTF